MRPVSANVFFVDAQHLAVLAFHLGISSSAAVDIAYANAGFYAL